MSLWRTVRAGMRSLLRRDVVEQELDDELRHYLAMATEANVRAGMSPEAAERAARVKMGGVEATKAQVRSGGWEATIDALRQDVRVGVRGLLRSPGFTAIAVLSLALGIGATTTMFSVVNAVMFRPFPYADTDRLALIWTDDVRRGLPREETAYPTITDWQTRNRTFQDVAYFTSQRVSPIANDPARSRGRTRRAFVSANLFSVLGVAPLQGRFLSSADERDRAPVAVISYAFWQRWFQGTPDVIGRTLTLGGASKDGPEGLIVIGVLPAGFYFPDRLTDVFTPATTYWRFDRESTERFSGSARRWTAIGRLASGASVADARSDLDRIGRQLAQAHPANVPDFPGFAAAVVPVLDSVAGASLQSALWILLGAVSLVLLVVCANVANLQLARSATRQREFAVRRALGAGRGRLVCQLAAESMVLLLAGGAVGAAIAAWGTPLLATVASAYVPRMDEVTFDWRVLSFAAIASIVSGLAFGLVPALRLSATDANAALREGGHGTASGRLRRSQGLLVLAECAMALVLLTGAGLLLKSLNRLQSVDPGFDARGVLTMRLEFPVESPSPAVGASQQAAMAQGRASAWVQWAHDLTARVQTIPGVESAGFIDDLFIGGQGNESITIPGRSADEIPAGELAEGLVTPGFFAAMRAPLKRGRYPTRDDAAVKIRALWSPTSAGLTLAEKERLAIPEPVVVNEAFVRRFFSGEDPIGKRFCIDPTNKTYWYVIVGVVGDMHRQGLERAAIPQYFGPYIPSSNGRADLVVRTAGDPLALASTIRAEVTRALPSIVVVSAATAEAQLGGFSAQRRLQTLLLTLFAALALMIAGVGIFGLAHYTVADRTREIGVRVALGATPRDVLRLLIAQGMRMPALGIAIGLVASVGLTRIISNQLYDVEATDPATFITVAGVLAIVAAVACYTAARRAARANPVDALRQA
ncbi:MAG: ABC transporter permease [Gemmatimonadaceae bacterium]